jgi:transcriptional regulator, MarR family
MKTLTQWLIDRLRGRERTHIELHAQSGEVIIRQGLRRVRLSHAQYLQIEQLKGWQR